ncbi:MAG: potassium-transporting ATPase subunit KdpA, partial [Clostridia bacterium]
MTAMALQYGFYVITPFVLAAPLGLYISKVMNGEKVFLSGLLLPCERLLYRVMRIDPDEQMHWKKYLTAVLLCSGVGFIFLFLLT